MDVVLYLRYSSDRQTEQSIEGQRHVCEKFCERSGYNIVGEYVDRATSASKNTDKRVNYLLMIDDSSKHQWQGVVVYKLDRFARNRYDSAIYKAKLKKNGVRVISATENLSDNPEGILLESVLEGMAEFYSRELAQKVSRGMYESALKCNSCGGTIPLGYKSVNKKLEIDEKTAPAIQKAFEMYANGQSAAEIARHLNACGYRSSKGSKFNKNSFHTIFKNKKYIGYYTYKNIEVENAIPAIVDKDTFDKVQARLAERASAPARGKAIVDYLLSGKMFCGHCGSVMIGTASTSRNGNRYYYYNCSGRRRHSGCTKSAVPKTLIEKAIVQDTLKLLTPDMIDYIADLVVEVSEEERAKNTLISSYKAQLADIDKSITNLLKLVENGADSPTLSRRLNELEKQSREVKKALAVEESQAFLLDKDTVITFLEEFTTGDIDKPDFQRRIIDLLVNSVYVWDSENREPNSFDVTITYNVLPEKTSKITVKDLCVFNNQSTSIGVATTDQIISMAENNLGIGFVPEFIYDEADHTKIFKLQVAPQVPAREICLLEKNDHPLHKAAEILKEMIVERSL